jgi:hypothetical protein
MRRAGKCAVRRRPRSAIVSMPCTITSSKPAFRAKAGSRWRGFESPDASA